MSDRPATDDMESWFDRMNREFREAARMWEEATPGRSSGRKRPSIDVVEHDDAYEVRADLPGFTKEDVEVRIGEGALSIETSRTESMESETEGEDGDGTYVRRERHSASMSRRVKLPRDVDADGADATMEHGVLSVSIPKIESAETGKTIEID
jgi:HSP20 family protein